MLWRVLLIHMNSTLVFWHHFLREDGGKTVGCQMSLLPFLLMFFSLALLLLAVAAVEIVRSFASQVADCCRCNQQPTSSPSLLLSTLPNNHLFFALVLPAPPSPPVAAVPQHPPHLSSRPPWITLTRLQLDSVHRCAKTPIPQEYFRSHFRIFGFSNWNPTI